MYVPAQFAEADEQKLYDFIERHSFASLVSHDGGEPVASHLPLLLERDQGTTGSLMGHMARANPQWRSADGRRMLVMFHGPRTYISPKWYESGNAVPTWNYVAAHVYGTFRLDDDQPRRLQIVRRYVEFYEAEMDAPWSLDHADEDFVNGLLDAIVGFRIDIERIEGKWKLSQNHDPLRRLRVIRALREAGGEDRERLAELMADTLEPST